MISAATKNALERKLLQAIKDIHRPIVATAQNTKQVVLTNRMLLPYYKLEQVRNFMDIFTAVDGDFSGDLDVNVN